MFVSLRGALAANALIALVWLTVHVVSLQRVHKPTDVQVRRQNAITRKLQACPGQIAYQSMAPMGEVDLRSDSGCRASKRRCRGCRGRGQRLWHSRGKLATAWTRTLANQSPTLSTRTASLTACRSARTFQRRHLQQPRT
eukprot:8413996-Pyramimonas_sp.AAC.1